MGHSADVETAFNPNDAMYVKQPGSATVTGIVALKSDSGTLLGDFAQIRLVPVNDYSIAVMQHLFEGSKTYFSARTVRNIDRRYEHFMRLTKSDHEGRYTLNAVPAGQYFIYGAMAAPKEKVYFGVQERVTVADGQKYQVDLDGV